MNLIIPMAGMGKRMRPHTLLTPKPLIPVGGKPIVQRLVEDIAALCDEPIKEIGFIIGDFGKEVEDQLLKIAASLGATGHIYYQEEALGTAHAIHCAAPLLKGPVIVAFADTLFKADFKIDDHTESMIWVKQIDDPSQFGVVKLDDKGYITNFVEKPQEFVSDLAMIGIYFFKDGAFLKEELEFLMNNNIMKSGEYQLPDAMLNMKNKGTQFLPGKVDHWMDCGNKNATVETNSMILGFEENPKNIATSAKLENTAIIEPVFIGENAVIKNATIGPNVSVGEGAMITDARISDSIIREQSIVKNAVLNNSMVGTYAKLELTAQDLSIGDFSTMS